MLEVYFENFIIIHFLIFCQDCQGQNCVSIRDYESIFDELPKMANRWEKVLLGKKWAYSGGASYAVYDKLPDSKKELELSPILLMKAQKIRQVTLQKIRMCDQINLNSNTKA